METKVINLFAGPGAGKSTTAAEVFVALKKKGIKVELVREFAKELEYRGTLDITDQSEISHVQYIRQSSPLRQVEYIITDGPLILGNIYGGNNWSEDERERLLDNFGSFNNINYFIQRTKEYEDYGRSQTKAESLVLDSRIQCMLDMNKISYKVLTTDEIVKDILDLV